MFLYVSINLVSLWYHFETIFSRVTKDGICICIKSKFDFRSNVIFLKNVKFICHERGTKKKI